MLFSLARALQTSAILAQLLRQQADSAMQAADNSAATLRIGWNDDPVLNCPSVWDNCYAASLRRQLRQAIQLC